MIPVNLELVNQLWLPNIFIYNLKTFKVNYFWFYDFRLKILRYGRYEYPPLHLYLDPVEFLEIDCQNYFINRKILFHELNKIFLLRKYKICQYVYWTIFVLGRRGIQLLQEIEKKNRARNNFVQYSDSLLYPQVVEVLSKHAGLWITRDKEIMYSQATHINFICPMRFDNFPLDTQVKSSHIRKINEK